MDNNTKNVGQKGEGEGDLRGTSMDSGHSGVEMDASGLYEMARGFHDGQATLLDEFPTQDGSQVLDFNNLPDAGNEDTLQDREADKEVLSDDDEGSDIVIMMGGNRGSSGGGSGRTSTVEEGAGRGNSSHGSATGGDSRTVDSEKNGVDALPFVRDSLRRPDIRGHGRGVVDYAEEDEGHSDEEFATNLKEMVKREHRAQMEEELREEMATKRNYLKDLRRHEMELEMRLGRQAAETRAKIAVDRQYQMLKEEEDLIRKAAREEVWDREGEEMCGDPREPREMNLPGAKKGGKKVKKATGRKRSAEEEYRALRESREIESEIPTHVEFGYSGRMGGERGLMAESNAKRKERYDKAGMELPLFDGQEEQRRTFLDRRTNGNDGEDLEDEEYGLQARMDTGGYPYYPEPNVLMQELEKKNIGEPLPVSPMLYAQDGLNVIDVITRSRTQDLLQENRLLGEKRQKVLGDIAETGSMSGLLRLKMRSMNDLKIDANDMMGTVKAEALRRQQLFNLKKQGQAQTRRPVQAYPLDTMKDHLQGILEGFRMQLDKLPRNVLDNKYLESIEKKLETVLERVEEGKEVGKTSIGQVFREENDEDFLMEEGRETLRWYAMFEPMINELVTSHTRWTGAQRDLVGYLEEYPGLLAKKKVEGKRTWNTYNQYGGGRDQGEDENFYERREEDYDQDDQGGGYGDRRLGPHLRSAWGMGGGGQPTNRGSRREEGGKKRGDRGGWDEDRERIRADDELSVVSDNTSARVGISSVEMTKRLTRDVAEYCDERGWGDQVMRKAVFDPEKQVFAFSHLTPMGRLSQVILRYSKMKVSLTNEQGEYNLVEFFKEYEQQGDLNGLSVYHWVKVLMNFGGAKTKADSEMITAKLETAADWLPELNLRDVPESSVYYWSKMYVLLKAHLFNELWKAPNEEKIAKVLNKQMLTKKFKTDADLNATAHIPEELYLAGLKTQRDLGSLMLNTTFYLVGIVEKTLQSWGTTGTQLAMILRDKMDEVVEEPETYLPKGHDVTPAEMAAFKGRSSFMLPEKALKWVYRWVTKQGHVTKLRLTFRYQNEVGFEDVKSKKQKAAEKTLLANYVASLQKGKGGGESAATGQRLTGQGGRGGGPSSTGGRGGGIYREGGTGGLLNRCETCGMICGSKKSGKACAVWVNKQWSPEGALTMAGATNEVNGRRVVAPGLVRRFHEYGYNTHPAAKEGPRSLFINMQKLLDARDGTPWEKAGKFTNLATGDTLSRTGTESDYSDYDSDFDNELTSK